MRCGTQMRATDPEGLRRIYCLRFAPRAADRERVWKVLVSRFFQRKIPADGVVLDLGCGRGEFINNVVAGVKYAIDLNPEATEHLATDVTLLSQDSAARWGIPARSLDVVFTSNFLEHLPDKAAVEATVIEAVRCLRPGGLLVAMGPNIRYLPGSYWDFWDHHVPLSDAALGELLQFHGLVVEQTIKKFLPYTMVGRPPPPTWAIRAYLKAPLMWRILGKQFVVFARKSHDPAGSA